MAANRYRLVIGNKNWSSWSLRPWLAMRHFGLPFDEINVRLRLPESKAEITKYSPSGMVPLLLDGDLAIWDSLAIAEYVAEKFPGNHLWPAGTRERARARSVVAEMHSGFGALRTHCPMNIEASLPHIGALVWRDQAGVRSDVERIVGMWTGLLQEHKGPMLFGEFSAADAFFAPVCLRIRGYALPVPGHITDYVRRVCALPAVKSWMDAALKEEDFVVFDEPYRTSRS